MTSPYRAMIARMADELDHYRQLLMDDRREAHALATEARTLLAQPVAEGPTNETPWEIDDDDFLLFSPANAMAFQAQKRSRRGHPTPQPVAEGPTVMEIIELHSWLEDEWRANNDGEDLPTLDFARAVLAKWGTPPPQPVWADIHYVWELEDAEGEWQAGGSANSLEDVQREGNRYLQTYSQDGPHKLIIQRHCVSTIEEVTNG